MAQHCSRAANPPSSWAQIWDKSLRQERVTTRAQRSSHRASSKESWSRVKVTGDGNCLFRALAQGSHRLKAGQSQILASANELEEARELRASICRELRQRQSEIEPFLDGNFDAYVRRMESNATWGGEPELAVAPHCLQRPVDVFTQRMLGPLEQISSYGDEYKPAAAVSLFFHQGGHYDLLVPAMPQSKL